MEKTKTKGPVRRTIFLTNPKFQLSFLGYTLGMAVVVIAIFYAANMYFFLKFAAKGRDLGLPANHVFFKFLHEQQHTMDIIFLGTSAAALIFLVFVGFYLSNRVAGSLYRMENHLQKMKGKKEYQDLHFRKTDYFQDLADSLNEFVHDQIKIFTNKD